MRTTKQSYDVLERELELDLSKKQFGKKAHAQFFSECVEHLKTCIEPNCHIRSALNIFCTLWEEHEESLVNVIEV